MFESNYDYGSTGYAKEYAAAFFEKVKMIKLVNGEILIGFLFDGQKQYTGLIDFPFECVRSASGRGFDLREYTPALKLRTVMIPLSQILFVSDLDESLHMSYVEHIENIFEVDEEMDSSTATETTTIH